MRGAPNSGNGGPLDVFSAVPVPEELSSANCTASCSEQPNSDSDDADKETLEIEDPLAGTLLFRWLTAHFPCRLFSDSQRSHRLDPRKLFQVHPSPAVELLQQQHMLKTTQQHCLKQTESEGKAPERSQVCPALLRRLEAAAGCSPVSKRHETRIEAASAVGGCSERNDSNPLDTSSSDSSNSKGFHMDCLCEAAEGLQGRAWICSRKASSSSSSGISKGPPVGCVLDVFECPCESCIVACVRSFRLHAYLNICAFDSVAAPTSVSVSHLMASCVCLLPQLFLLVSVQAPQMHVSASLSLP